LEKEQDIRSIQKEEFDKGPGKSRHDNFTELGNAPSNPLGVGYDVVILRVFCQID